MEELADAAELRYSVPLSRDPRRPPASSKVIIAVLIYGFLNKPG
jgi:hypothetical protein